MTRCAAVLLRPVLVVVALGSALVQILVPIQASELGHTYPEVAHLVIPYSVAAITAVVCSQAVLVAVWFLLRLIRDDLIFTPSALRWVDVMVASGAGATVLAGGVLLHLIAAARFGGAGTVLGLFACIALGTAFSLIVLVLRGLLATAIADRGELAEVI